MKDATKMDQEILEEMFSNDLFFPNRKKQDSFGNQCVFMVDFYCITIIFF